MYLRALRYMVLVCLSLGLISLFAACTSTTTGNATTSSGEAVGSSQRVTPTNSSTATSTTHTQVSAHTGSTPVGATPVIPTPTPLQPTPRATVAVKGPTPTAASTSHGPLTLVLACSGPNAQDGVSATDTQAKACIYTSAGARLTITASFCNGKPDPNSALQGTFTANNNGFYEWNWTPQPSCRPISSWSVSVNAQLDGQSASVSQASSVG